MLCGPPGFTGERMCTPGHYKETEAACVATDPTPARHAQPTVYISLPPPPFSLPAPRCNECNETDCIFYVCVCALRCKLTCSSAIDLLLMLDKHTIH